MLPPPLPPSHLTSRLRTLSCQYTGAQLPCPASNLPYHFLLPQAWFWQCRGHCCARLTVTDWFKRVKSSQKHSQQRHGESRYIPQPPSLPLGTLLASSQIPLFGVYPTANGSPGWFKSKKYLKERKKFGSSLLHILIVKGHIQRAWRIWDFANDSAMPLVKHLNM